ncbi:DUF1572 family protein [Adhaeribacter pallidiroseus]|uniref:DinB-like domain-containing protein n=1 Tax=Adhaeribacter pallidiroseus TaxID=2072847 RepID=A0A369QLW6_9BACT|nr:DUF1572 family protein [Adhaeribacter pallidiroseus]RDC65340.1 hypothetical protein AHMF7616_03970 [Adhaeribacter pallidiroseus]
MLADFIVIYDRDLIRLKNEIQAFTPAANLWRITGQVTNTAGNLGLHLVGNLKTYIGKNLGNNAYVRDREAEFSLKNVPQEKLIQQIEETRQVVAAALQKLDNAQLANTYPKKLWAIL